MSSLAPIVHGSPGGFAELLMYWWMGAEAGLGGVSSDAITVSQQG